jgi:hypothetical protein
MLVSSRMESRMDEESMHSQTVIITKASSKMVRDREEEFTRGKVAISSWVFGKMIRWKGKASSTCRMEWQWQ